MNKIEGTFFGFELVKNDSLNPEVNIYYREQLIGILIGDKSTHEIELQILANQDGDHIWRFNYDEFEIAILTAKRQILHLFVENLN